MTRALFDDVIVDFWLGRFRLLVGRGEAYYPVEVQALGELGLGVHGGVVGDQDMVCEYGFCCILAVKV